MIIVRIWEGLGNQLFQYAYARALQERIGKSVYLDIGHSNRGDLPLEKEDTVKRSLGIQHFNISLKRISTAKVPFLHCLDSRNCIAQTQYRLMKKGVGIWNWVDDENRMGQLCQDILRPRDFTYVNAHCLNKGYYGHIKKILMSELQIRRPVIPNQTLADILESRNTVSIHIRLTDYLKSPKAICSQEYYNRAIQYIEERVTNPCYIIFSDDPDMAKRRYHFKGSVYWVGKEEFKDYEAIMVMSKCRHNIIAESTFSYWGAWLNTNPEKIVIASRKWFGGSMYERNWKLF